MSVLVIENYASCPVGAVGAELRALGAELTVLNLLETEATLPEKALEQFSALVVLGGAMGAYDDDSYPAIPQVLRLLRSFHDAGKPILAICLGAQMLARALGEPYKSNDGNEIGFVPVRVTPEGQKDPIFAGAKQDWFAIEWHEDNFHIPPGAIRIVEGEACRNQGFKAGQHSYAFQFHPEIDEHILRKMIAGLDEAYLQELGAEGRQLLDRMLADIPAHIDGALDMTRLMTRNWYKLCNSSFS